MSCDTCPNVKKCQDYIDDKGATVEMKYTQTLEVGELDIVSFCNLNCYSCNRFMDVMPSKDVMSLEQVKMFVDESIELEWPWKELRIMGGEPSLHPQFKEVCEEILRIREYRPDVILKVITNGTGKKVNERLKLVPPGIKVMNSGVRYDENHVDMEEKGKRHVIPDFGNMWQAPIDRPEIYDGNNKIYSCQIHQTCGLGISQNGILPCGCGNAIGRTVGLDFFFKSLKDVTVEACHERLKILCALCGRNLNYTLTVTQEMEASPFWQQIFKDYKKEEPKLVQISEARAP